LSPAQFDDDGLPADGVSGAVQNVGDRYAASEVAVDINVIGIQDVRRADHRGDGDAALVHAPVNSDMRVAIDNARDNELALRIDYLRVFGCFNGFANFRDFAILNKYGAVLDRAVRDRENGGVLNQDHWRRVGRIRRWRWGAKPEKAKCEKRCGEQKLVREHGWNFHSAPPARNETLFELP
jgi:hypothetical protein